jgi:hypothetical protein
MVLDCAKVEPTLGELLAKREIEVRAFPFIGNVSAVGSIYE